MQCPFSDSALLHLQLQFGSKLVLFGLHAMHFSCRIIFSCMHQKKILLYSDFLSKKFFASQVTEFFSSTRERFCSTHQETSDNFQEFSSCTMQRKILCQSRFSIPMHAPRSIASMIVFYTVADFNFSPEKKFYSFLWCMRNVCKCVEQAEVCSKLHNCSAAN